MAKRSRATASTEIEVELPDGLDEVRGRPGARARWDGWKGRRLAAALRVARAKAMQREPRRQAEWLLDFESKDLFTRHPRTYRALCGRATRRFVPDIGRVLTLGELRDVHRRIHTGLDALRLGKPWVLEPSDPAIATLLPPPRGRAEDGDGGAPLVWRPVRHPVERFVLQAMRALAAVGNQFRLCRQEKCRMFFVSVKRREVCEDCAAELQKGRVERWRSKHHERVLAVAHEAYVRRERKEKGYPNAKVKRIPRTAEAAR